MKIESKQILLRELKNGEVFTLAYDNEYYIRISHPIYTAVQLNKGYLIDYDLSKIVRPVKAILTVEE